MPKPYARDMRAREKEVAHDLEGVPPDWLDVVERGIERLRGRGDAHGSTTDDRKTMDEVFDKSTLLTLWKFINNGLIETLDYPVSTGKEANVFHATRKTEGSAAVKIFRTNTATFRAHLDYIEGDPRFGKIGNDRRSIVFTWTQKEFKNLQRYFEAAVRVPMPIAHQNNVLVMEFVGEAGTPAPLVKDAPPEDAAKAYDEILDMYAKGYAAGLVHGDLSEFNILNHQGELVIIDVGQAVLSRHPLARDLLLRDAKNLARYFKKLGVATTPETTLARMTAPEASK